MELPESTAKIISVLKLGIKMALALRAYLLRAGTSNFFFTLQHRFDVFSLCSLVERGKKEAEEKPAGIVLPCVVRHEKIRGEIIPY